MFTMDEHTQRAIKKFPHRAVDIVNSFDYKKIYCKNWMVKRLAKIQHQGMLKPNIERIYIIGGWYGNQLIPMLDAAIGYKQIHFIEQDEEALYIAKEILFKNHTKIKWIHGDATDVEYDCGSNLVINTSAEHMKPLNIKSAIYAVQSNDYYEVDDHTHCVESEDELESQYDFSKTWYKDFKSMGEYNRFMVIGRIRNED